jgi:arylformamidase
MQNAIAEKRVKFDFEIDLSNGGGIQGQDFRLDIEGEDIADQALSDFIVKDLRLLMVRDVRILNKEIICEPHKRATPESFETEAPNSGRLVDLSHTIEDGMITYKGLPAPLICDFMSREASQKLYAEGHDFSNWKNRNGGQHRDLPRQPIPSLRARQGPGRAASLEPG